MKTITTYSMWKLFRNCRKACEYRYLRHLVPLEQNRNLHFGSIIHDCLETWYSTGDANQVLDNINHAYINRNPGNKEYADWHLALAMMKAYIHYYPSENFKIVALEKVFKGPIVNPLTNAISRSFVLSGKVDGIVKQNGLYYLLEHKTASRIDRAYLEQLWTDFQIILYAWYLQETMGVKIAGIIYNILVKAKLQQGQGETENAFEARRKELIAKSKTGTSLAKRKMPESDSIFQERLKYKYSEPGMFHREILYISQDRFNDLRNELWNLSQAFLEAKRTNNFYKNPGLCFQYNHPCAYFPICQSNDNPLVIENCYEIKPPHEELEEREKDVANKSY